MLKIFKAVVLGGRSGKREMAAFLVLAWIAGFIWCARKEAQGIPMDNSFALLTVTVTIVGAYLAAAYGMEWHSSQSKWRGEVDSESEVGFE